MTTIKRRRWSEVQTVHGLPGDQIASALQKEIRRGQVENAALIAYEMVISGADLEAYLWSRLMVISVEDIGFAEPSASILVHTLYQMVQSLPQEANDRKLFAIHAVRYLCSCQKDRSSDEMTGWISHVVEKEGVRPTIPDYALDGHTVEGRARGRGIRYFYEEGAKLEPELANRDTTYRDRIMALLDEGKL
ncbi:MAG: hypothetical protein KF832_09505 [Caldilineaceae bacterium]|nr:hypothetical protein [Caldilineaceae bacterium]